MGRASLRRRRRVLLQTRHSAAPLELDPELNPELNRGRNHRSRDQRPGVSEGAQKIKKLDRENSPASFETHSTILKRRENRWRFRTWGVRRANRLLASSRKSLAGRISNGEKQVLYRPRSQRSDLYPAHSHSCLAIALPAKDRNSEQVRWTQIRILVHLLWIKLLLRRRRQPRRCRRLRQLRSAEEYRRHRYLRR